MGQAAGCGMEASEEEERMSKDYYSLISRIKADEALKEKLIVNLREKQKQKQGQHAVKGVFMKMKVLSGLQSAKAEYQEKNFLSRQKHICRKWDMKKQEKHLNGHCQKWDWIIWTYI